MCEYFIVWGTDLVNFCGQNGLQRAVKSQQVIAGMLERMKVIAHHQLL